MRFLIITTGILVMLAVACGGDSRPVSTGSSASTSPTRKADERQTEGQTVTPLPTTSGEAGATPTTAAEELELRDPPAGFTSPVLIGAESECAEDRTARVVLTWQPAQPPGVEQQVHLLEGTSSFAQGGYLTSQMLEPQVSILYWEGLTPGSTYYWRAATRVDGGWVVVDPQRFSTESCPPIDPIN